MSEDHPWTHSGRIFMRDLDPDASAEDRLAERRAWWERHRRPTAKHWVNSRDTLRKLRVGYVSADFKTHSAAFAFSDLILGRTRRMFEVACYSMVPPGDADEVTAALRASADTWRDMCDVSDEEMERAIRDDGIDILVDLSGHTAGHRLPVFTAHPAPIQVHAIGYLPGTGLPEMDYIVLDPVICADEAEYVEKVCHVPCALHFRPPMSPPVAPLPALTNGYVTFGYLGRWGKVRPATIAAWRELLARMPAAQLHLKSKEFRRKAIRTMVTEQLGAGDRVKFFDQTPHVMHLQAHGAVDIVLDPFDANGGVSNLDALWMGVPIVTRLGKIASGRVGASLMTAIGLTEYVAATTDDYVDSAIRAASDLGALSRLRSGLRRRMESSTLGNGPMFVAHVESLYRQMWKAYCS